MRKAAAAALFALLAFIAMITLFQASLLFPVHAVPSAGKLPADAERWDLLTTDGETLHGVHFPPEEAGEDPEMLVLGFGGNAWNAQEVATYLHRIVPDAHVVAYHYRGYRPSTGRPSSDALMSDAPQLFDQAVERIRPTRTVAVGFSIGSGVAASLSRQRQLDGIVLVTPFDSLKAVAQDLYPWLPVGPFFQHEMAAADDLAGNSNPVAILAAERDGIIPAARTKALRQRVANLTYDRNFAGAGHNDIYQRSDFQTSLAEAIAAVAAK